MLGRRRTRPSSLLLHTACLLEAGCAAGGYTSDGPSLPAAVTCQPQDTADDAVDVLAAVQKLVGWAISDDPAASDGAVASECILARLVGWAQRGTPDDDQLLLLLVRSPGLALLADLAKLISHGYDLALDPWLREHCRTALEGKGCGSSFAEVVQTQASHWQALSTSLYRQLQPVAPGPPRSRCFHAEDFPLSVVGTHSGLSVAVATAAAAALQEVGGALRLAYFGHWAWCQNVGNCNEPLANMFKKYQQDWAETEEDVNANKYEALVRELSDFFSSAASEELLSSSILLCTRPFLFCWLLRSVWPAGREQVPMLHYYSGPLLFDVPAHLKTMVLSEFRRTVLDSHLDLVVSSSALQSAWMLSMAGVAVPHVRPHAAQLRGLYTPVTGTLEDLRALVLRSTWTSSLMGRSFRSLLARLTEDTTRQPHIRFDWLLGDKFLSYEEISNFHAAVFLPEQPDKLTFWEQYEMAMPLWLPSAAFWVRIHAIGEYRYSVFANKWQGQLMEGEAASLACDLPAPLFFQGRSLDDLPLDSPLTAAFWFYLTDYALFPHLQLFDSAADLVAQISGADLADISRRMAAFNQDTWQASAGFYRAAVCSLTAAGELSSRAPLTPRFMPQPDNLRGWSRVCGGEQVQGTA